MRIYIPVISRLGPKVIKDQFGAHVKDKNGELGWEYDCRGVTGKGIYICGTARGATLYITKVLRALGYDVGHEKVGADGSVGYHLALIRPDNCLHQVRHPLKQIASMLVHQAWGFMDSMIDLPNRKLLGCMTYWLEWNKLCDEFCVWRYKIEDLPEIWDEFLEKIGHKKCDLPDIPTNENSSTKNGYLERKSYEILTWDNLFEHNKELAQKIKEKSDEYGYSSPQGQRQVA